MVSHSSLVVSVGDHGPLLLGRSRRPSMGSERACAPALYSALPSMGAPALDHPLKPVSRCARLGRPMTFWSVSAARADRPPPAQNRTMRFSGSTLPR